MIGKSVLELGCGPGLNSIIAAIAGASFVCCSDGDEMSVELAEENFKINLGDCSHCVLCGTII